MAVADQFDGAKLVPACRNLGVAGLRLDGGKTRTNHSGTLPAMGGLVFSIIVLPFGSTRRTVAYCPLSKTAATCNSTVTGSLSSCDIESASDEALSLFLIASCDSR
jgi:hypothetical protein